MAAEAVTDGPNSGAYEGEESLSDAADSLFSSSTGDKKADNEPADEPHEDDSEEYHADDSDESEEPAENDQAESDETDESDEDEDVDAPAPKQSQKFKVKLDDGEHEVDEDELKAGYMRQADYTRKRQIEAAEVAAAKSERAEYQQYLTQLKTELQSLRGTEPDWAALANTPEILAVEFAKWQLAERNLQNVEAEQRAIVVRNENDAKKANKERVDRERVKLYEVIPEWKNSEVAVREAREIQDYGKSLGFSEEDLKITDHRIVKLLRDGALAKRAKSPAVKAKIEAVKMATPGNTGDTKSPRKLRAEKAAKRVEKSGDVKDAAEWLIAATSKR